MNKTTYEFSARAYQDSSSKEVCSWTWVSLPKELSMVIRENYKYLEKGWGRMNITARLGKSEWQSAIWFDTKQDVYLLPIKAKIRKQENVMLGEDIKIIILV